MKKILLIAAFVPFAAAAQTTMQPGEWEFTSTMTGAMFPKPQSATVKQCVSKEDAADPTRFASQDKSQGCTVKPGAKTADSYQWEIACPAQGLTGSGTVRHTPTTMNAEMKMVMTMQGGKSEMNSKVSGRFLGPCKSK